MNIPRKIVEHLDTLRLTPVMNLDEELALDSLQFIRLSAFIQDELGVGISDDELTVENFRTLRSLQALIARKTTPGGAPAASGM